MQPYVNQRKGLGNRTAVIGEVCGSICVAVLDLKVELHVLEAGELLKARIDARTGDSPFEAGVCAGDPIHVADAVLGVRRGDLAGNQFKGAAERLLDGRPAAPYVFLEYAAGLEPDLFIDMAQRMGEMGVIPGTEVSFAPYSPPPVEYNVARL